MGLRFVSEKVLNRYEKEYDIPISESLREDVSIMCNLSQGIEERATKRATELATKRATELVTEKVVINMHKKGYTSEQIAEIAEISIEKVEAIIMKKETVLV